MTVVELSSGAVALAAVAVAAGSAAQAVTGFGFALVSMPVLVLLLEPADAVPLGMALAMLTNLVLLVREHRELHVTNAVRLLVPGVAVTPPAAYLVHRADAALLSVVIGLVVLICALVLAAGRRAPWITGSPGMITAGAISAVMNTGSGVGGPAVALYAVNADWSTEMTRPTLQVYFLGLNAIALAALGPVTPRLGPGVALALAIVAGFVAGTVALARLSATLMGQAVLALSVVGGTAAVIRGLLRL